MRKVLLITFCGIYLASLIGINKVSANEDEFKKESFNKIDLIVELKRTFKYISPTEVWVNVLVNKKGIDGFARFIDSFSTGYTVGEVVTNGGTVISEKGKLKIVWMKLPDSKDLKISYKLKGQDFFLFGCMVEGTFSYLVKGHPVQIDLAPLFYYGRAEGFDNGTGAFYPQIWKNPLNVEEVEKEAKKEELINNLREQLGEVEEEDNNKYEKIDGVLFPPEEIKEENLSEAELEREMQMVSEEYELEDEESQDQNEPDQDEDEMNLYEKTNLAIRSQENDTEEGVNNEEEINVIDNSGEGEKVVFESEVDSEEIIVHKTLKADDDKPEEVSQEAESGSVNEGDNNLEQKSESKKVNLALASRGDSLNEEINLKNVNVITSGNRDVEPDVRDLELVKPISEEEETEISSEKEESSKINLALANLSLRKNEAEAAKTLVYRIQLTVGKYKLSENYFKDHYGIEEPIFIEKRENAYAYAVGKFSKFEEAKEYKEVIRETGLPEAFIVAYINEQLVSVQKALKLESK